MGSYSLIMSKGYGVLRVDPVILLAVIVIALGTALPLTHKSALSQAQPSVLKTIPPHSSTVATEASLSASSPMVASPASALVFESSFYDFGTVTEGDVVKRTFKFRNEGSVPIKIIKTETSCGCTTANGALKEYAPGEQGEMEVVVDTVGKKGIIVKTVKLSLAGGPKASEEITLTMSLVPPPHPKKEYLANLNTDSRCKGCHLENGQGQTGIFLYHRVCVQCHGKKGVGATARALNDAQWQQTIKDDYIRKRIVNGWPEHGMPSFVKGVSPALDTEQVESLIQYIRKLGEAKQ